MLTAVAWVQWRLSHDAAPPDAWSEPHALDAYVSDALESSRRVALPAAWLAMLSSVALTGSLRHGSAVRVLVRTLALAAAPWIAALTLALVDPDCEIAPRLAGTGALVAVFALAVARPSPEASAWERGVACVLAGGAVIALGGMDALFASFHGPHCHVTPPDPASSYAYVEHAFGSTSTRAGALAASIAALGAARSWWETRSPRPWLAGALAATVLVSPLVAAGHAWRSVHRERRPASDPALASASLGVRLPQQEGRPHWLHQRMGTYRWPLVVVGEHGVRAAGGPAVSWSEAEAAHVAPLLDWIRARNPDRSEWRHPGREDRGVRVAIDADAPARRLLDAMRMLEPVADGLVLLCDLPTRPFWPHVRTPTRQVDGVLLWSGSRAPTGTPTYASITWAVSASRSHDEREHWLEHYDVMTVRPNERATVQQLLDGLAASQEREGWDLVVLDVD